MKSERVWKSNLGDFESSVSSALYRVCVSLSLVSFYYKIYDDDDDDDCLLYTSPSPRDRTRSRMPSSA